MKRVAKIEGDISEIKRSLRSLAQVSKLYKLNIKEDTVQTEND